MKMKVKVLWSRVSSFESFSGQVFLTFMTNILAAPMTLLTGALVARLLGPEGRGEFAAIQIWANFIATLAMLGLAEALVFYSANDPEQAATYTGSAMSFGLISSIPFMGIGYILIPLFLSAQSPEIITAARWYLLLVPLYALGPMIVHPLQGRGDFAVWNGLRLLIPLGYLSVVLVAWFYQPITPPFISSGYLAMQAILFIPLMYIVRNRVPGSFRPEPARRGKMLRYGLPSVLSSVPDTLNNRLDQMLMAALFPSKLLGFYVVAVAWSSVGNYFLNAMGSVLFPRVASKQKIEEQTYVLSQGLRIGVLFTIVTAFAHMALTPLGIPFIFGSQFISAVPAAVILVVAGSIFNIKSLLVQGTRGLGHTRTVLWAEMGGLLITFIALVVMLAPFGIMGAAFASVFGYGTTAFLLALKIRCLTESSFVDLFLPTSKEVILSWKKLKTFYKYIAP